MNSADAMQILALLGLITLTVVLWRLQRAKNEFDVLDLFTEYDRKGVRRAVWRKIGTGCALVASTWGFFWLILTNHMTEWYFVGYMAAWCGYDIARVLADKEKRREAWTAEQRAAK